MEHWSSHVSLHVNERKQKKKRDFPLDPIFLIGWCGLTVDSSKVLGTRLLTHTCPESGVVYELLWVDLMRTVSNNWLKIISLNVQSVFFNRVGIGVPKVSENLSVRILWAELNRLMCWVGNWPRDWCVCYNFFFVYFVIIIGVKRLSPVAKACQK